MAEGPQKGGEKRVREEGKSGGANKMSENRKKPHNSYRAEYIMQETHRRAWTS